MQHRTTALMVAASLYWSAAGMVAKSVAEQSSSAAVTRQAVVELGAEEFAVRERATLRLWRLGAAAADVLRAAATSDDPEVATRAQKLLDRLRWGIRPDTPPQTRQLIDQFRFGSMPERRAVLVRLEDADRMEFALDLIAALDDPSERQALVDDWVHELQPKIRALIGGDRLDLAERLLRLQAGSPGRIRDFAAFLLLTGRLASRRAELANSDRREGDRLLLLYLHRAAGDLDAARKLVNRSDLEIELAIEADDFQAISDWSLAPGARDDPLSALTWPLPARLGLAATAHRLVGRQEEADDVYRRIKRMAQTEADSRFRAIEALLVGGRGLDAVDVFLESSAQGDEARNDQQSASPSGQDRLRAARVLIARGEFDAALRAAGLPDLETPFELPEAEPSPDDNPPVDDPFGDGPALSPFGGDEAPEKTGDLVARFELGRLVATTFASLGRREAARSLLRRLASLARRQRSLNERNVIITAREAGETQLAIDLALALDEPPPDARALAALFGDAGGTARVWWLGLHATRPTHSPREHLTEIQRILDARVAEAELKSLADAVTKESLESPSRDDGPTLLALADIHTNLGNPAAAEACLATTARRFPTTTSRLKLADFYLKQKRWDDAAEWYRRVVEDDDDHYAALYLRGYALRAGGDIESGDRYIRMARLLPFDDPGARGRMAIALETHGFEAEAAEQWNVLLRTGEPNAALINNAAKRRGNQLSGKDDARAAALWLRMLLSTLKPSASLSRADDYLRVLHMIHRLRARGLLAAGEHGRAVEEARFAMDVLPDEAVSICDLVPRFDRAGLTDEADTLFETTYRQIDGVIQKHPDAARKMNNLAWMAAVCHRRLDDALRLSLRATEAVPDNPVYLDTLAEVRFQRGERAEAVELARRCVALAPRNAHYREQLDRFTREESAPNNNAE